MMISTLPWTEDSSSCCCHQTGYHPQCWQRTESPWHFCRCTWRWQSTCRAPWECTGPRSLRRPRCRRGRPWRGRRRWWTGFRRQHQMCQWRRLMVHLENLKIWLVKTGSKDCDVINEWSLSRLVCLKFIKIMIPNFGVYANLKFKIILILLLYSNVFKL